MTCLLCPGALALLPTSFVPCSTTQGCCSWSFRNSFNETAIFSAIVAIVFLLDTFPNVQTLVFAHVHLLVFCANVQNESKESIANDHFFWRSRNSVGKNVLMSRGCEPPQAFQANLPFRRSSFIFPIYLYFSSSVSVDGGLFASNIRFSRRPADSFVNFLTGTLPPSSVRILHQWSCGCWRIRWPRSGGRSLLVFPTVGGIM